MKSRILSYIGEETDKMTEQIANMPFKQIHLSEGFAQSHRDVEHPDIQQSVMWHLSKVVEKSSLAPEAMLKTFISDPEAAKSMTAYTFDKEALLKLRQDLIENPQKYE